MSLILVAARLRPFLSKFPLPVVVLTTVIWALFSSLHTLYSYLVDALEDGEESEFADALGEAVQEVHSGCHMYS